MRLCFLLYKQGLRGVCKLDPFLFKAFMDMQVDVLLDIHEFIIVRTEYKVDRLKDQCKITILFEMRAIETGFLLLFHRFANDLGDLHQFIAWSLIGHTNIKGDSTFEHATKVANATIEQIGIGKYQLLTG